MKTFKRISATFSAQINSIIDQIEDHEAVSNAVIGEIQDALLRAKFQVRRIQNEQMLFENRKQELVKDEAKWKTRALDIQVAEPEKALECVRRLQRCRTEIKTLNDHICQHSSLQSQLVQDVNRLELQFEKIKSKRSTLAARESRAAAQQKISECTNESQTLSVFDRWEEKILKQEVAGDHVFATEDSLSLEFEKEEERIELQKILSDLISEAEGPSQNNPNE